MQGLVGRGGIVKAEALHVRADVAGTGQREHLDSSGSVPQYVVATETS